MGIRSEGKGHLDNLGYTLYNIQYLYLVHFDFVLFTKSNPIVSNSNRKFNNEQYTLTRCVSKRKIIKISIANPT